MKFNRVDRVSSLLHRNLTTFFFKELELRTGLLTITKVSMSSDLKIAKIYYSFLGVEKSKIQSLENKMTSLLFGFKRKFGRKMESLKQLPQMQLVFDDTPEKAQRIEMLIEETLPTHDELS